MIAAIFFSSFSAVQTAAAEVNVESEIQDAIVLSVDSSKVLVNGKQGRIDENNKEIVPFVENGNTMVPLRFLTDKLGGEIAWNKETQEITIEINGDIARIRLGETTIDINDRKINMNVASKTINGITYLPLRHVVEDLFQKKLYYKNGIIIISDDVKTVSESTLTELERKLKPRVVYVNENEMFYVYSDGTSFEKKLEYNDREQWMFSVAYVADEYFYIQNDSYRFDFIHKINLDGTIIKTVEFDDDELMNLIIAKDGYQYYNAKGNILRLNENDPSTPQIVGQGILMQENIYIKNDEIWFTDSDTDYAIYKLHNGEKIRITNKDYFIKHVLDDWIYYAYYENKRWTLYRMLLDGSNKTKLSSNADVKHSYISNGKIYYIDENSKTLSVMSLDGSDKRVICKLELGILGQEILKIDGGYIYYTEEYQEIGDSYQFLFRVNISDGTKVQLVKVPLEVEFSGAWIRIDNVNILGDFVYYSIGNVVFVVKDDGSDLKKVYGLNTSTDLKSLKDN
jgi:Copper amine oxidase N-terminal domain/Domain of unknown function (DUF5050)